MYTYDRHSLLSQIQTYTNMGNIYSIADDTTLVYRWWLGASLFANIGTNQIKKWLDMNLLSLNINKTTLIPFTLKRSGLSTMNADLNLVIHDNNFPRLEICRCTKLKKSTQVKYLGIIIVQHLRWEHHINFVCLKLRKTIYNFVLLRHFMQKATLKIIYKGWGISYGNYFFI